MEALEKEMVPGMLTYAAYKIVSLPCFIHIITIQEVEHWWNTFLLSGNL